MYMGVTNNLKRRVTEHKTKRGAKYTKDHVNFKLCYKEEYATLKEARRREVQLKKWSKAKKLALISGDFEKLKNLSNG